MTILTSRCYHEPRHVVSRGPCARTGLHSAGLQGLASRGSPLTRWVAQAAYGVTMSSFLYDLLTNVTAASITGGVGVALRRLWAARSRNRAQGAEVESTD